MKVVILNDDNAEEIIEHFVSFGYDDFIVFQKSGKLKKEQLDYFCLNDITVTVLKGFYRENTSSILSKIRGSLTKAFFLVYSAEICYVDLDRARALHNSHQGIATLIQIENSKKFISSAIFEQEVFDYISQEKYFEKETLKELCQDLELMILNQRINE